MIAIAKAVGLVDSHRDEAGREACLSSADTSGRRYQAREDGGRGVDEDELRQIQIDAASETGRPEGEGVEQLGGDVPAEKLQSFVPIARDFPEAGERAALKPAGPRRSAAQRAAGR